MILVDANILLYAKLAGFKEHARARVWLDDILNSSSRCGIPWERAVAFIRISTNPRVFERPLGIQAAWQQVKEWLSRSNVWVPAATEEHLEFLNELIPYCAGNAGLIHDAHLAAIARCHGLTIFSADSDFARFPKVKWENPIRPEV